MTSPPESGSLRFSLEENENIKAKSMSYFRKNRDDISHISQKQLESANEIVDEMVDYMKPYLDKANNKGKRYLPEEILGDTRFQNGSYGRTIENTTICFRTLAYIDFTNDIKERIGRPLTVEESFLASQMLYDIAKEPQCLYCYVSLDRKAYDEFLLKYIEQRDGIVEKINALSSEDIYDITQKLRDTAQPVAVGRLSKSFALGSGISDKSIYSASENVKEHYSCEPETLNELRRQNMMLRERVEYWKGQTKPAKEKTLNKNDVHKLAMQLKEIEPTDLKTSEIEIRLNQLGRYILNTKELRFTDVAEMAEDLAWDIVDNMSVKTEAPELELHNDIKSTQSALEDVNMLLNNVSLSWIL